MNMLAITLCLFTAVCILKSATAQDIKTTCPATGFTEGVLSNISCTVNRNFYDNICLTVPVLVTFSYLPSGGSDTQWCSTSYTTCETKGQSQTACLGCSCLCSDENPTTNINTYILTFDPIASYTNGSFFCEITCAIPSSPETKDHSSCENARVAQDLGDKPDDPTIDVRIVVPCVVFGVVAAIIAAILLCGKKSMKVCVGDNREQIGRIDSYVVKLNSKESKQLLNDIAQKGTCCGISPAEISVDGFRSIQPDDRPKNDQEPLHVLVSVRFACACSLYEEKVTEVREFLRKNVTPLIVMMVPVSPNAAVDRDSLRVIGQETGTTIYTPAENRQGQTVIQIEGLNDEQCKEAKRKVEHLI